MPLVRSILVSVILSLVLARAGNPRANESTEAYHPHIDPADFQETIDNAYFPLVPGTVYQYIEKSRGGTSENEVVVTGETRTVMGVTCVVVSDKLMREGVLEEETLDWYAQDKQGNVWYFGEATKEYDSGGKADTSGSWEAGVDGAQPGIIMPARPAIGAPYRQEYIEGRSEDMGQIVALNETVTSPSGTFSECVKTREWSSIDGELEHKWYAKGIGLVRSSTGDGSEVVTLVSLTRP